MFARGGNRRIPRLPFRAQVQIDGRKQAFKFLLGKNGDRFRGPSLFRPLTEPCAFLPTACSTRRLLQADRPDARWIALALAIFAGVFLAYLTAFKLEQVFGAKERIFSGCDRRR